MTTCEACSNTMDMDIKLYKFPQNKEPLQQWITNIGKAEEWTPSESSALCSAHFSPECFDGSAHLRSDAIPTIFSPGQPVDVEESGNPTNDPGTSGTSDTCDCEKRLQIIEKSYRLKLLNAKLQINRYQKELSEQTHKTIKWQRKALILQSVVKGLRERAVSSTKK